MSLHSIYYEFQLNKKNLELLAKDLELRQGLDLDGFIAIPKFKPGINLKFAKEIFAERLPRKIAGVRIYEHASSEGQLDLKEFSRCFEASLEKNNINYVKYE